MCQGSGPGYEHAEWHSCLPAYLPAPRLTCLPYCLLLPTYLPALLPDCLSPYLPACLPHCHARTPCRKPGPTASSLTAPQKKVIGISHIYIWRC